VSLSLREGSGKADAAAYQGHAKRPGHSQPHDYRGLDSAGPPSSKGTATGEANIAIAPQYIGLSMKPTMKEAHTAARDTWLRRDPSGRNSASKGSEIPDVDLDLDNVRLVVTICQQIGRFAQTS